MSFEGVTASLSRLSGGDRRAALLQASPSFLENLPVAIYACDREGRVLWYNSQAAELWGREPRIGDTAELYCGSHRLYFGGRLISRDETPMASVLRTGVPVRGLQGKIERPDGSLVWATVYIEPVEDENGNLIGAVNCFHDTSAMHQASEDVQDFFENAPVGLHLVGGDGTILRANRAELELLGYRPDEYIGRNITEFHVDAHTIADILSKLRRGEVIVQYPARLRAKDGSIKHVLITSNARRSEGGVLNTRCFTIDVTGSVNAKQIIHDQEGRLAATYEHAGIGIVEVDAQGRLLRVNEHICELMGCGPEDLVNQIVFDHTLDDDVSFDREQFQAQVAGRIDRYSIEKRIRRKDGSFFWALMTSSSVKDSEGKFLYAVRVQHDITTRKNIQRALQKRMEELGALYEFTERLQHVTAIDQVYEPALDGIVRALGCQRASILLFDDAQVMRFVAWRGLSDSYRRVVDRHSPWDSNTKNAEPICIPDVSASDLPPELKKVVLSEGIQALAFIPVLQAGVLLGKFMTYYNEPHPFESSEISLAVTLAHHLAFSIDRLRNEAAERRLGAIVESSDDAIISKDLNGTIQTWNEGAERLFGYSAQEAIGRSITILIPADRQDEEPAILARIRAGERIDHYETIRRRKDGSLVDISLTVSPVRHRSGTIIGASKIARDITDRKRSEAALQDSERRLRDLLSAIPAAIYTTDEKGRITYYNEAAVEIAGRRPTLGSDEWCVTWKLYWPDGTPLPHDQCPMAMALKEQKPVRGYEAVAERPDGTRVPFIPFPTPLFDTNGKLRGAINMLVDISERKQAETQQRLLLNELNHRVKNNMQMLQSLLYTASAQSVSSETKQALNDACSRVAAMAAAQRVLYGTTDATHFGARDFIESVIEAARQGFAADVKIICDEAEGDLSNDIAMPLALILNELLTNAVKHGLKGQSAGTIRVGLHKCADAESSVLYVEDEGSGFNLEAVRARSSGLQLVQGLARQLRGRFEVTRVPTPRANVYFP